MQSAKHDAEAMIRALPEDATFEDMQYGLYVLDKLRRGLESLEEGGVAHEDAKAQLDRTFGRRDRRLDLTQ